MVSRLALRRACVLCRHAQSYQQTVLPTSIRHASAMAVPTASPPEHNKSNIPVRALRRLRMKFAAYIYAEGILPAQP